MIVEDVKKSLVQLGIDGVVELRVLKFVKNGKPMTVSGYYDDPAKLAADAEKYDGKAAGLYFTLNSLNPALLNRRANRAQEGGDMSTTTDAPGDVAGRRFLPVDIDPKRPAGISSTDAEHQLAIDTAYKIRDRLSSLGWPAPVVLDSGNGAQMLYRVDLDNTDKSRDLVKACIDSLALLYSDEQVDVDHSVFNASRIWKLPGTMACKGDNTPERPHRRSRVLECPEKMEVVPTGLLEGLARLFELVTVNRPSVVGDVTAEKLMDACGVKPIRSSRIGNGTIYTLDKCPKDANHIKSAWCVEFDDGGVALGCPHNSCGCNENMAPALIKQYFPGAKAKKSKKPKTEAVDEDLDEVREQIKREAGYTEAAMRILKEGDIVKEYRKQYNRMHVGDEPHANSLLVCVGTTLTTTSAGMHPGTNGESGSGKTDSCQAAIHLMPQEYVVYANVSDRALFYTHIEEGSIFFLDDVQGIMSETLTGTMKQSTSQFQTGFNYKTLDKNRNPISLHIPPRCSWWLTSVDNDFQDQLVNRQLIVTVDGSKAHRDEIVKFIKHRMTTGEPARPLDDDVLVVREAIRILKKAPPVAVKIPFAERVDFHDDNTRNLNMFFDTIMSLAALRQHRRNKDANGCVIATMEDFDDAVDMWKHIAESQVSKLTKEEIRCWQTIKSFGDDGCDINQITEKMKLNQARVRVLLHGENDKGGIMGKIVMRKDDITETTESSSGGKKRGRKRIVYVACELDLLSQYDDLVTIAPEDGGDDGGAGGDEPAQSRVDDLPEGKADAIEARVVKLLRVPMTMEELCDRTKRTADDIAPIINSLLEAEQLEFSGKKFKVI